MIFKQLFDQKSCTYTYLIASSKGREALVIDPVLENITEYIKLLKELDLKLVKVIDTHIHADHVTGASKLKDITNPKILPLKIKTNIKPTYPKYAPLHLIKTLYHYQ